MNERKVQPGVKEVVDADKSLNVSRDEKPQKSSKKWLLCLILLIVLIVAIAIPLLVIFVLPGDGIFAEEVEDEPSIPSPTAAITEFRYSDKWVNAKWDMPELDPTDLNSNFTVIQYLVMF